MTSRRAFSRSLTLRTRLAVAVGVVVAVLATVGFLLPGVVWQAQVDQLDRQLNDLAPGARPPVDPPDRVLPEARTFSDVYFASVSDDGRQTTYVRSRLAVDRQPDVASIPLTTAPPGAPLEIVTVGSVEGGGRWRAARVAEAGDEPTRESEPGGLVMALPLDSADAVATRLRWLLAGAGVVIAGALALASLWVLRLGLRPLSEIASVADAISDGERDRRVSERHPRTEAGHVAKALNVMLDERAANEDRLRRFVADASHELRTPVAAIRGFTDLHRQGAFSTPEERDAAMRRIGQESARIAVLVDDLLLLAHLDEGRPMELRSVDVACVLRDAAFDASATHPSRVVDVQLDAPVSVLGDEARVRQVVANLTTNALVHAGPDARVTLSARSHDGVCVIDVVDDGIGMDPAAAEHAFDRFWRNDPARTRASGGAGLGLAIVKAIVDAHHGLISLDTAPDRGTTVRVVIPSAG
jgi:two-component system, OmpR family, sensor kinase